MVVQSLLRTDASVLVVEDEYYFADDIAEYLRSRGVNVVGPSGSLRQALSLAERTAGLDGAILDIRLQDGHVYPLADALQRRGIPFVFVTAYAADGLPARFRGVPVVSKPSGLGDISAALELRSSQMSGNLTLGAAAGRLSVVSVIPEMRLLSTLYAGSPERGDELLAGTLTEAYLLHRQFDGRTPVKLWLAKLLRRQAAAELRAARDIRAQAGDAGGGGTLECAEVLLLVCKFGFGFAQAAEVVGVPPSEIEIRLRSAIGRIGGRLPW